MNDAPLSYGRTGRHTRAGVTVALLLAMLLALAAACGAPTDGGPPTERGAVANLRTGSVEVSEARVRTPVAGQDKTAGYLTLTNHAAMPLTLVGAESPAARAIEFHRIDRDGDMVRMRRMAELVVAPGATVRLEPGGLHLMLFGVTALEEPFMITLLDSDGERFEVPFRITAPGVE